MNKGIVNALISRVLAITPETNMAMSPKFVCSLSLDKASARKFGMALVLVGQKSFIYRTKRLTLSLPTIRLSPYSDNRI